MITTKRNINKSYDTLKRTFDIDATSIDTLSNKENTNTTLYAFVGIFTSVFFDTKEELNTYLNHHDTTFGIPCTVEYIKNYKYQNDVIKRTTANGETKYYAVIDEENFIVTDDVSDKWYHCHGDLKSAYKAFRDHGINFNNDLYYNLENNSKKLTRFVRQ